MENNASNFDRIEAYLFGHLSAGETTDFEQEIDRNEALAREVEQQRLEHRAMELMLRDELRANLQRWKAEAADIPAGAKTIPMHTSRRLFFKLAAAASVALVIGFFARQFFSSGLSNEALAMAEFDTTALNMRGSETDGLAPAYQAMARQDYPAALLYLNAMQPDDQPATVRNLRGECYFRLRQYPQAIATYQELLQTGPADGDLREKAEWRLLLSQLAQGGQPAEVQRMLNKIIAEGGQFAEAAGKLKEKVQ